MKRVFIIRHGEAAAGWDADRDPGLSEVGQGQAKATADKLMALPESPTAIISSPLLRAQQTAAPYAAASTLSVIVDPRVSEIPSPTTDLAARSNWLRKAAKGNWENLGGAVPQWQSGLLECIKGAGNGSVFFCHYMVINAVVSEATGDPRVVCCQPAPGSIHTVDTDGKQIKLVALGEQLAAPPLGPPGVSKTSVL
eukprot:gene3660-680_t